jgi:hypothetical protein
VEGDSIDNAGVSGSSINKDGVFGWSVNQIGVAGVGSPGVAGLGSSGSPGVFGLGNPAGGFLGDVNVLGNLKVSGGNKQFQIDHPLDPANRYLNHFCVESSEAKNVYDGRAKLDQKGEAVVELPPWFQVLNKNFNYQLTPVGKFAPLYIAQELSDNRFTIAGGDPGMEICWHITGVRNDAHSKDHPTAVEEEKPEEERGYYVEPTAHGAAEEKGIAWARYPALMQRAKEDLARRENAKK